MYYFLIDKSIFYIETFLCTAFEGLNILDLNFSFLFFKAFLGSGSMFTAKLRGRYRDFPYSPVPTHV